MFDLFTQLTFTFTHFFMPVVVAKAANSGKNNEHDYHKNSETPNPFNFWHN
jgi:hypothetical protein